MNCTPQKNEYLSLRRLLTPKTFLLTVAIWLLFSFSVNARRIYVDITHTTGTLNGTSWATAYSKVDVGLSAAVSGDSLLVAQGSYTAPAGTSYIMKEGVAIYGGFFKTDTAFSQRDWINRLTTLRASSRTVIRNVFTAAVPLTSAAILDGFTIAGGSAGSATPLGGGMANVYASPTIRNVVFSGNTASSGGSSGTGGGMYNSYSSPVLTNVRFINNTIIKTTDVSGGGMYNSFSSPILTNVVFETNQCTSTTGLSTGGAMANFNSSPVLRNVAFKGNYCTGGTTAATSAVARGGAIGNYNNSMLVCNKVAFSSNYCIQPTVLTNTFGGALFTSNDSAAASLFTNVVFTDNSASNGAAIYGDSANIIIVHGSFNGNNYRQSTGIGNIAMRRSSRFRMTNSVLNANAGADTVIPALYIINNCYNETAFTGSTGTGNIVSSSMPFIDPLNPAGTDDVWFTADDGLRLKNGLPSSPVNAGITISVPDYPASVALEAATDILGVPRPAGIAYDMGAYEGGFTKVTQRYYVDSANVAGTHDGASWATAYNKFEDALPFTGANDIIWVARGTYQPAYGSSFKMKNGTAIYGGFKNTDTGFSQRDYVLNKSILKGNARSVIINDCSTKPMMTSTSILDGFTITGGEAIPNTGGGMSNIYASPMIRNVIFSGNTGSGYPGGGGGMYNSYSSPVMTNVTISGNSASSSGGGMYNWYSSPVMTNVTISNNTVGGSGGGMYNFYSSPVITNSTISGNTAKNSSGAQGGGIANWSSSLVLTNVVFDSNRSNSLAGISAGGGMANYGGSPVLTNVIFSRNRADNLDPIITDPGASSCGGAIANYNNTVMTCNNIVFDSNYCLQPVTPINTFGGAVFNNKDSAATSVFRNVIFQNNSAAVGAAMYSDSAKNLLVNATFNNNKFMNGTGFYGTLYDLSSRLQLVNCIFYAHTGVYSASTVSFIVQNSYNSVGPFQGSTGAGNIVDTSSPFVNNLNPKGPDGIWLTNDDGLQLNFCSTALNAGNNDSVANTLLDILGHQRIKNSIVDIGAYEKQSNTTAGQYGSNAALSTGSANALSFPMICDDNNGWTYYADPAKPDSLGFAINWGANNNAAKTASKIYLNVDAANTKVTTATAGIFAMRRYWNVDLNGTTLTNPVQVRFYYNPADTVAMHSSAVTAGLAAGNNNIQWFKTTGVQYNPSQVTATAINGNSIALRATYGSDNNIAYVQFNNITSFSGGTAVLTGGAAVPLPVKLLDFTATKNADNRSVLTSWQVASEDLDHYEVERSTDATTFQTVGKVMATGKAVYTFNDALSGNRYAVLYYRLKMMDRGGDFTYSPIKKVTFDNKEDYTTIFPNPATSTVTISNTNMALNGRDAIITDATGRLVRRFVMANLVSLNVNNYQPGIYFIKLPDGNVLKLVKE